METHQRRADNDRLMGWIGLSLILICLTAFALTAGVGSDGLKQYRPMVFVHGVTMLSWFTLFTVQSWLMSDGAFARHYMFGRLSIGLVILMIASSIPVAIQHAKDVQDTRLLSIHLMAMLRFAILYGAALGCIILGYTGLHRRLMLLATTILISPTMNGLPGVLDFAGGLELITGMIAAILLPNLFDLGSGGLRRSTLFLSASAVFLEMIGLVFAIGFLEGVLAGVMFAG